jgi:hypothetical protein
MNLNKYFKKRSKDTLKNYTFEVEEDTQHESHNNKSYS